MTASVCVEEPDPPPPQAGPDVCPVVSLGTPPLTFMVFMLVSVVDCLSVFICHSLPRTVLSDVCVSATRVSFGVTLTQSASALAPEGADGGVARALLCPPNTRSC